MRSLTPYWATRTLTPDVFDEVERLFQNFARLQPTYDERVTTNPVEISEEENHFLLSMDIPGIRQEDLKIDLNGNTLTISGERKRETSTNGKSKIQHYERSYGSFSRSFTLPSTVDAQKIEARYESGVLELYLPKAETAKARRIEIQANKGGFFDRLMGKKDSKDVSPQEKL